MSNTPSSLPAPWHVDAAGLEAFVETARRDGCRVLRADLGGARDKAGVLAAIAAGLALPDYFGGNLDALYDCLTDLPPHPGGIAIALAGLPRLPQADADGLLGVFGDAIEASAGRAGGLRVAYSTAR